MGRYKLRSHDQPFWLQAILGLFEFCASLKLAVVLIFTSALVLGWGTVVESLYGTPAVQFGIYGTWWFTLLNALLALNIFSAAAIRYPWKRHQTGFVITHIGLLTLLFGCLLSRTDGIDAQMPIWEGKTNYKAYCDSQHFQLVEQSRLTSAAATPKILPAVAFDAGTFDWSSYSRAWLPWRDGKKLYWFPWKLAHRDRGVIYDAGGIKLEVIDYLASAAEIGIPFIELEVSSPAMKRMGADGREHALPTDWSTVELSVRDSADDRYRPSARELIGGGQFVAWMSDSPAETAAFLDSAPALPIGPKGQVVLHAGGQRVVFSVEDKLGQPAFALGESGLKAEVVRYVPIGIAGRDAKPGELRLIEVPPDEPPRNAAVELRITGGDGDARQMVLFADYPERSQQLADLGVFGSYWFDYGKRDTAELMSGQGGARIDVLQSADKKLHYRYWNRQEVVFARDLPSDGTKVDAFKMPIGQLSMYVDRFIPSERPARDVLPLAFDKNMNSRDLERAARLRMTVDGQSEEFWLVGPRLNILGDQPPAGLARHTVTSDRRSVSIMLLLDTVDFGFDVRLDRFERKLDPGTAQPSHYGSYVDFEEQDGGRKLDENVSISMNAPVDFRDPTSGRKYRLFQEAFQGPFERGDGTNAVELVYGDQADDEPKHMTVLTVNYDPGRGLKYAGCLFVIAGIFTMFWMRAYFFKPAGKKRESALPHCETEELVAAGRD